MTDIETHLALLELATAVLTQAQDPPRAPTVVVVDALPVTAAILAPVVHGVGGSFLDLRTVADKGVSDATTDDDVHRRVVAALAALGGSSGVEIRRDADGRLRAFSADDASAYPPGDDLILAAGTVALSPALQRDPLVVIAYDETGQDLAVIQRLWTFFRSSVPDWTGPDTALTVVCGADRIDYERMCGVPPAARLFIRGRSYVRRNTDPQDDNVLRFLASGHPAEHLVLFLGAGFSVSSGLALGNELRDIALREYLSDDLSPSSDLPGRFYEDLPSSRLLTTERGFPPAVLTQRLTLERVLRELTSRGVTSSKAIQELERKHASALASPGAAVRHLHRAFERTGRKLVVITVNFDELIEHGQDDRVEAFADDAGFVSAASYIDDYLAGSKDKIPVLKVHGTIGDQSTLVFNIERTAAGLPPERISAVESALRPRHCDKVPVAYVGASMRDEDLTPLLTNPSHIDNTDEYWVSPLPVPSVRAFWDRTARVARWRDTGRTYDSESRFITRTADDALDRLADALGGGSPSP